VLIFLVKHVAIIVPTEIAEVVRWEAIACRKMM